MIINDFIADQFDQWPEIAHLHRSLPNKPTREIEVKGLPFKVYYLPHRIKSTLGGYESPRGESPLADDSLLPKQKSYALNNHFSFLVNPFPIFTNHGIIRSNKIRPQAFYSFQKEMIDLCRMIGPDYTLLFNGAKCGASIPQHFHLHLLPAHLFKNWFENPVKSTFFDDGLRKGIVFKENEGITPLTHPDEWINSATSIDIHGEVRQYIFFRKAHRHRYFPNTKEITSSQLLISPGVVDVMGCISCVREDDVKTLTPELLAHIFEDIFI